MQPGQIKGTNRNLASHPAWRERFKNLPIRDERTTQGSLMSSAWLPTPEELQRLNAGEPVILTVFGHYHPPVDVTVGETLGEAAKLTGDKPDAHTG